MKNLKSIWTSILLFFGFGQKKSQKNVGQKISDFFAKPSYGTAGHHTPGYSKKQWKAKKKALRATKASRKGNR